MSNQQLSIEAFKLFKKGYISKAWELTLESETLNEGVTFEVWFSFNKKRCDGLKKEQENNKTECLRYLKFNN